MNTANEMANDMDPIILLSDVGSRKRSKIRLVLYISIVLLLVLSVTFAALYFTEKLKKPTNSSHQEEKTKSRTGETESETDSGTTCTSPTCVVSAADILDKLDQSTKPCDDFYQFCCGGFLEKGDVPDYNSKIGMVHKGVAIIQRNLKNLFENNQLMSTYSKLNSSLHPPFVHYQSCMNESYIEDAGVRPVYNLIEKHGSWGITNANWSEDAWTLEKMLGRALADVQAPVFLAMDVKHSIFKTSEKFITISGGFSGFDETTFDEEQLRSKKLVLKHKKSEGLDVYEDYRKFMSTVFNLFGSNSSVDDEVNRIVDLEDNFLRVRNLSEETDLKALKDIAIMTVSELNNLTSFKFNWTLYLEEIFKGTSRSIALDEKIMIYMPNNIKLIVNWLTDKPKGLLANEIIWNIVRAVIDSLPKAFREAQQSYYNTFGLDSNPRWKTCVRDTCDEYKDATTLLYVKQYITENALKTAIEMFTEIKGQFIAGLDEQEWMDNKTRAHARLKLQVMKDWIGISMSDLYANKLIRYFDGQMSESDVLQNKLNIRKAHTKLKINELSKPTVINRRSTSPLVVNAFYQPKKNGITILPGMLQLPYYEAGGLKAFNYGSLGTVIGHEITHGFDKTGSQYDENGNLRQWWTNSSYDNFVKRSQCLIDEYNNVTIFGLQANGERTLSENIADNGGLKYAYRAYQKWRKTNGDEELLPALPFDNNQLFFISYAQSWCAKFGNGSARDFTEYGVHSLDPVRVRVPLRNFPEFSKAFGCLMKKDTCAVW
ncbi:endothelin-converting enzyme homolog [Dendronephthya gigantea]|uniref:endothelin-converting enzyme homolog n=1 Tax=Dendronephthya gigantea TaxID=151771 RepID=UPI00106D1787|nr:endothelin-converting enzyme homolog [Dendronephthya gigantea]